MQSKPDAEVLTVPVAKDSSMILYSLNTQLTRALFGFTIEIFIQYIGFFNQYIFQYAMIKLKKI